jgi:LmbE family N-acetylglucosaminyl deacetylase
VSGLAKLAPDAPKHRPHKVLHCVSFRQDFEKPTFVVDVSAEFEQKMEAIRCYGSQFDGATQAGEVYPAGASLYEAIADQSAYYGSLIRVRYGEPFSTTETMTVDDVFTLGVSTY